MGKENIIYIDTGGTFSDCVLVDQKGNFISGKSPTTPNDLEGCFFGCIEDAAIKAGLSLKQVLSNTMIIGFGTTAGTNALITRSEVPKLGLITTKGFEDTTTVMRMEGKWAGLPEQVSVHIAGCDKPDYLVPRKLIKGVNERIDCFGKVALKFREDEVRKAVSELCDEGVEGIAVAFLWSFLNNAHERRASEIIAEMAPDMPVSLSSRVAPVFREYPRFNSAIINLYIGKPIRKLFSKINKTLNVNGYKSELMVMQSSGGLSKSSVVEPISTLNSGPVGGLIGVHYLKGVYGEKFAIGTDMGGTSFDLCLSKDTGAEYIKVPVVARYHLANPMLGVISIGAGGGTIAYVDKITGRLRMGPQSAGAVPGPCCYGLGGTEPTVTDADVVMNRINPDYFLDGKMKLKKEKAEEAIEEKVARPLKMIKIEAARGICMAIDEIMKSEIQTFMNRKGIKLKDAVLFVFGGAGPTHCAGFSAGLGFKKIIVPPYAATFSAFGASTADVIHRYSSSPYLIMPRLPYDMARQRFNIKSLDDIPAGVVQRFNETFHQLKKKALADMEEEGFKEKEVELSYWLDMRYGGQLYEAHCPTPVHQINTVEDMKTLLEAFENEYIRLYSEGTQYPKGGAEIITVTVLASAPPVAKPKLQWHEPKGKIEAGPAMKGERDVYFKDGWMRAQVYAFERLLPGMAFSGPAIAEGNDTTLVVPRGFKVDIDGYNNVLLKEV